MKGILLVQLGTPDSPTPKDVGRYLREFLMDPYVVDIPLLARFLLVNLVIVPFRSHRSAEAYQKIWSDRGSPLRYYSESFARQLQQETGRPVALGMRYGHPNLESALQSLVDSGVDDVLVAPLYPQFAAATSRSSLQRVRQIVERKWPAIKISELPPFYDSPEFIASFAERVPVADRSSLDHLLISFHGIPERQVKREDSSGNYCLASTSCCDVTNQWNKNCYRRHCLETAKGILKALAWDPKKSSVSFQSRLGRTPWLRPFTDLHLAELAKSGVKRLGVVCPSFVADCLETLEEIELRGREIFMSHGGQSFTLYPCPNDSSDWVRGFAKILEPHLSSKGLKSHII